LARTAPCGPDVRGASVFQGGEVIAVMTKGPKVMPMTCIMLAGLAVAVVSWMMFQKEYAFHHEQLPGMCSDARFHNQTITHAKFFIDDTFQAHGVTTMRCAIPLYIYPCPDDDSRFCARFRSQSPLPTARTRYEVTTVRCHRSAGAQHCKAQDWHCHGDQACDAYEKAQRLCIHKLKVDPYECFYVPNKVQGPDQVRFARRGFPIWCLLGSIVMSLVGVALCWLGATVIREDGEKHGPMESIAQSAFAVLCFGCIMAVIVVLILLLSRVPDSPLGQIAVEAANLTQIGEGGTEILPEEEPVPTTPWWHYMLIMLAIFAAVLVAVVAIFQQRGETKEEEEEEEDAAPFWR